MALDITQEVINIFAWLGVILITILLHHFMISPIFNDYGQYYVIANVFGAVFGMIGGKYIYNWYMQR